MNIDLLFILVGLSFFQSSTTNDESNSSKVADEDSRTVTLGHQWIITQSEFGVENEYFHVLKTVSVKINSEGRQCAEMILNEQILSLPPSRGLPLACRNTVGMIFNGIFFNGEGTNNADKFSSQTSEQLGSVCAKFKNCKIYQQVDTSKEFPEPSKLEKISEVIGETETFEYVLRPLKSQFGGKLRGNIYVFPCQTHVGRTYWLTYGYSDYRIFFLKEVKDPVAVQFVGQGELVPDVNDEYPRGKALEEFFYQATPKNPSLKPRHVLQNPFVESTRFRLCCLIHAVKQNARSETESFTVNYANREYRSIFHLHKVQNDHLEVREEHSEIEVRPLGCAVNRKGNEEIQFYLYGDYTDPNAVFALELVEGGKFGREPIFIVTEHFRVHHIPCDSATSV